MGKRQISEIASYLFGNESGLTWVQIQKQGRSKLEHGVERQEPSEEREVFDVLNGVDPRTGPLPLHKETTGSSVCRVGKGDLVEL
jgi:hypothetical protein